MWPEQIDSFDSSLHPTSAGSSWSIEPRFDREGLQLKLKLRGRSHFVRRTEYHSFLFSSAENIHVALEEGKFVSSHACIMSEV